MQLRLVSSIALSLFTLIAAIPLIRTASAQTNDQKSKCDKLLAPEDIEKATGLTVGKGKPGPKIAGANGTCVWKGTDGTEIIVTLAGRQMMQTTMDSMAQTGGAQYDGLGSGAVGTNGIPETGGGYNLSFTDAKGGVAVTIPGSAGTSGRTLALGKLIEKSRSGDSQKAGSSPHGQLASGHGQTASDQGQTAQTGP